LLDLVLFSFQFHDRAALASKAQRTLSLCDDRSKPLPVDQATLATTRTLRILVSILKDGSAEEKYASAAIISYVCFKRDGTKQALLDLGVAEPILESLRYRSILDDTVCTDLCEVLMYGIIFGKSPSTPDSISDDIQNMVEQRLTVLVDFAVKEKYNCRGKCIQNLLQCLADAGNACVQKEVRLNRLDVDDGEFFRHAAALQHQLRSEFLRTLELFHSLCRPPFSSLRWNNIKSRVSDLEIANMVRYMLHLFYVKSSVLALQDGRPNGPCSFRHSKGPNYYALGSVGIRQYQVLTCKCGISSTEAEGRSDFHVLWIEFQVKKSRYLLAAVTDDAEEDFRLPGGRGYRPSFNLLGSRSSVSISNQLDFWPCKERKIIVHMVESDRSFESIHDAERVLGAFLRDLKDFMGPRFKIGFERKSKVQALFTGVSRESAWGASLYSGGPQHMFEVSLKSDVEAFLEQLESRDERSLQKSLQIVVTGLARWSWYSNIFWHDYHIHLDEKLDDVNNRMDRGGHSILHAPCFDPNMEEARRVLFFAPELASQTNFCAGDVPAHYCTYFNLDVTRFRYKPNVRFNILKLLYSKNKQCIFVKNKAGETPYDIIESVCNRMHSRNPYKNEAFEMRDWLFDRMTERGWKQDPELGWIDTTLINRGNEYNFGGAGKVPGKYGQNTYKDLALDEIQYKDFKLSLERMKASLALQVQGFDSVQRILCLACHSGDLQSVQAIVEFAGDPALGHRLLNKPVKNSYQKTALISSDARTAKYLLKFVSTWSSSGIHGYTAFHWASHGSLGKLLVLLRHNPLGALMKSAEGWTPREMLAMTDDLVLKTWCDYEEGHLNVSPERLAEIRCSMEDLLALYEDVCVRDHFWSKVLHTLIGVKFSTFLVWRHVKHKDVLSGKQSEANKQHFTCNDNTEKLTSCPNVRI
jgi:hypothetical protein